MRNNFFKCWQLSGVDWRHVTSGRKIRGVYDGDIEGALEARFVEAWEGSAGVGWGELSRRQPPREELQVATNSSWLENFIWLLLMFQISKYGTPHMCSSVRYCWNQKYFTTEIGQVTLLFFNLTQELSRLLRKIN